MKYQLVMGNEAIALGAIRAGVNLVAGYPGTPSTEVLETVAKNNPGDVYVEWSVNEKAALETAAGAAYAGARVMVTMKQVGLNVASDPLMCVNYVGVKGGMVIVVADDPGPISSQTEQDTRHFAHYAKMMVFDPSSPREAYEMIGDAFEYSEKYHVPVFFRPTTRVCHGYETIPVSEERLSHNAEGFVKDASKWVIFPRLSNANHKKLEDNMKLISEDFSDYRFNKRTGNGVRGILTGGISYEYVMEALNSGRVKETGAGDIRVLKLATANAFPERLVLEFLNGVTEVLVIEELDPVLEEALLQLCGKYHLETRVYGKLTGHIAVAGENSVAQTENAINEFAANDSEQQGSRIDILGISAIEPVAGKAAETAEASAKETLPELPARPPVLCAGCPHRASFYAVKKAMTGKKTRFCGDIGCYTLGNAMPLDMVDTCLCMGAGVTISQGFTRVEPDVYSFAFIGDSTFFASGMTGVVNALYNQANVTIILLDNSTTAMTGHQPHPGTGVTMMGDIAKKINPEQVLRGMGVEQIACINPLELDTAVDTVKKMAELPGVKVIIFQSPCIAVSKPKQRVVIRKDLCIGCKKCIRELGCPGIVLRDGRPFIDPTLCFGCSLCEFVCPVNAIEKESEDTGTYAAAGTSADRASGIGAGTAAGQPDGEKVSGQIDTDKPEGADEPGKTDKQGAKAVGNGIAADQADASALQQTGRNYLLCGVGGQGTVLAAKVLAAAAIAKGENVKTTETIGMAQRGGSVVSHVRTGQTIHSPLIPMKGADLLIAFEPAEAVRNLPYLKDGGTVVVSSRPVMPVTAALKGSDYNGTDMIEYLQKKVARLIVLDTDALCAECGSTKVMNVILLGAAIRSGALEVNEEEIRTALLARLPEKHHELNIRALRLGMEG